MQIQGDVLEQDRLEWCWKSSQPRSQTDWKLVTSVHLLELQCEVNFNNDRNLTYSCVYTPTMEGEYRVIVKFATKEIPKSPYKVNVDAMPGNCFSVTAFISLWRKMLGNLSLKNRSKILRFIGVWFKFTGWKRGWKGVICMFSVSTTRWRQ